MKNFDFRSRAWIILTSAFVLIFGSYHAYKLRWISDDIFITFRYIENWLNGIGLVYNPGERVEGYTHFLWLILIAFFQKIGFNPVIVSEWLGLLSYFGILLVFLFVSYRKSKDTKIFFPVTAIALAFHYDFKVWATGGLETSFVAMLLSITFFTICFSKFAEGEKLILSGFLLTLALMSRPDALIFYTITFGFLIFQKYFQTGSIKNLWRVSYQYNLALIIVYIPCFIWKYFYYGSIFPNTYYAKSASGSYFSQGFFYLQYYFQTYWSSLSFIIGIVFLVLKLSRNKSSLNGRMKTLFVDKENFPIFFALLLIVTYSLFFIARVGGDFMFARFVIPLVPLFYFIAESSLQELFSSNRKIVFTSSFILIILLPIEMHFRDVPLQSGYSKSDGKVILSGDMKIGVNGIVDERLVYTRKNPSTGLNIIESAEEVGTALHKYFLGKKVRVLILGTQACLAYYSKFDYVVENYGLTDSYISHLPLLKRGRPGHERNAPHDYLVRQKINFMFKSYPEDYSGYQYIQFNKTIKDYYGCIITYDPNLMRKLKSEFPDEISFIDFEKYLDGYIANIKNLSKEQVKEDYKKFRDYYFLHNSDSGREKYFLQ